MKLPRLMATGLLAMVVVPLTVLGIVTSSAGTAQAFVPCYSSLTCQPENLPIVMEALNIGSTAGKATQTAAVVAKSAPGITGIIGKLGPVGRFVSGALDILGVIGFVSDLTGNGHTPGELSGNGVTGQSALTKPTYAPATGYTGFAPFNFDLTPASGPVFTNSWTIAAIIPNPAAANQFAICGKFMLNGSAYNNPGNLGTSSPGAVYLRASVATVGGVFKWASQVGWTGGTGLCASALGTAMSNGATTGTWNTTTYQVFDAGVTGPLTSYYVSTSNTNTTACASPSSGLCNKINANAVIPLTFAPPYTTGTAISTTISTQVDCKTTTGTIHTVTVTAVRSYVPGNNVSIPDALCPSGELAVDTRIGWKESGQTTETEIVPRDTGRVPATIKELPTTYPDCFGPSTSGCSLRLFKIGTGGLLESCGAIGELCPDWAMQPDVATKYQCQYGATSISINYCSAYRAPLIGVLPNIDSGGTLLTPTAPVPPATSLQQLVDTTGSTQTAPNRPVQDPTQPSNCFPTGWGVLNPASWVLQPIKCALEWAFVPRQSAVDDATAHVQAKWAESMPGKVVASLLTFSFTGPGTGCQGLAVNMNWGPGVQLGTKYFLAACPGDFFAPWAPLFNVFITGATAIVGFFGAARHVGGIFGYGSIGGDNS